MLPPPFAEATRISQPKVDTRHFTALTFTALVEVGDRTPRTRRTSLSPRCARGQPPVAALSRNSTCATAEYTRRTCRRRCWTPSSTLITLTGQRARVCGTRNRCSVSHASELYGFAARTTSWIACAPPTLASRSSRSCVPSGHTTAGGRLRPRRPAWRFLCWSTTRTYSISLARL